MGAVNELEQRILSGLSGGAKVRALLAERGYPEAAFAAQVIGERPDNVYRCLGGERERWGAMDRIRDKLARLLEVERAELDRMIDE